MNGAVILDANVLVALIDQRDKWHTQASSMVRSLVSSGAKLIYLDVVIAEAVGVLARRLEEQRRSDDFGALLDKLIATIPTNFIIWASAELQTLYSSVIDLVRQTNGVLNFNDALIAITARRLNVEQIAAFDADFDQVNWLKRLK